MAVDGKMLSELTNRIENIQGTERIYVSDGSGIPKYIETNQLVQAGGGVIVDSELSESSTNPVQNKVITSKFYELSQKIEGVKTSIGEIGATLDELNAEQL